MSCNLHELIVGGRLKLVRCSCEMTAGIVLATGVGVGIVLVTEVGADIGLEVVADIVLGSGIDSVGVGFERVALATEEYVGLPLQLLRRLSFEVQLARNILQGEVVALGDGRLEVGNRLRQLCMRWRFVVHQELCMSSFRQQLVLGSLGIGLVGC